MTMNRAQRRRLMRSGDHHTLLTGGPVVPLPVSHSAFNPLDDVLKAKPGEHVWVMTAAWRIQNPASMFDAAVQKFLDLENLLTMAGPGCMVCEREWSVELEDTPCPGDPALQS